jgi:hypothetical protein
MRPGMMGCGGCGMMGSGMMGHGTCGMMHGMRPGMMGYGGCGMMHGMGPGMMGYGGCGMMGSGMMGHGTCGMMHGMGPGMMRGYNAKDYEQFMKETKDLRKKMHSLKFEYSETARNPDAKQEDIAKLEKEMWELQKKIYDKWQK